MQKRWAAVLILFVVGAIAALWNEHSRIGALRLANEQRIAELEAEIRQLHVDLEKATKSAASQATTPKESSDLPQIRGAIAELRRRTEELERKPTTASGATNAAPAERFVYPDSTRKRDYTLAGFQSPASTLESVLWAISKLDRKAFESMMTPEEAKNWESAFADLPPDIMPGGFRNGSMYRATGFKVMEETPVSDSEVKLKIFLEGQNQVLKMTFKKIGNDWKWGGNF